MQIKNRYLGVLAALTIGTMVSSPASAFTATQDGVGVNVFYTQSGQTVSFHFQADFTGNVTGGWLGSYMDQIGLQFGDAANGGTSVISSFTSALTFVANADSVGETNTTGGWTGYTDKAGGNAPCLDSSAADAICYQIDPGTTGEAGDQIIGPAVYDWFFDVTFVDTFNIDDMLLSARSIKMQSIRYDNTAGGQCDGTMTDADCWKNAAQFSQNEIFTPGDDDDDDDDDTDVPEPGTLALLGLGLIGLGFARRRVVS